MAPSIQTEHLPFNDSTTDAVNGTASKPIPGYDHQGALTYVIAVCCVYALAIFFMIASHVRRRQDKREVDQEIQTFLRSQPFIRAEEELQRRRNLKKAMKPFIDLMINKRTIGVQADSDLLGNMTAGSRTFVAMYGAPGTPAFSEEVKVSDVVMAGGGGRRHSHAFHHHHHHHHHHVFRRQTGAAELNPSLLLRENEKSVQCNIGQAKPPAVQAPPAISEHSPSSSRAAPDPSIESTSRSGPTGTTPRGSYSLALAEAEFLCDLTSPIMLHFDAEQKGKRRSANFNFPRSIELQEDEDAAGGNFLRPHSVHIDREEKLWAHSPRSQRRAHGFTAHPVEEKVSSV